METSKVNQSIGEIVCWEKYKFFPAGLVSEVVRDFIKEYEKLNEGSCVICEKDYLTCDCNPNNEERSDEDGS